MRAKEGALRRSSADSTEPLYREIRTVLESARAGAYRAVNAAMVKAYWQVGRMIVEHEQGGRRRAAYGEAVLDDLSRRLTADFGRGFDVRNLRHMRSFFLAFPIRHALRDESAAAEKANAPPSESDRAEKRYAARTESAVGHPAGEDALASAPRLPATLRAELSWTIARYSVLSEGRQIFAAKYVKVLPTEQDLTREIERERRLIDARPKKEEDGA